MAIEDEVADEAARAYWIIHSAFRDEVMDIATHLKTEATVDLEYLRTLINKSPGRNMPPLDFEPPDAQFEHYRISGLLKAAREIGGQRDRVNERKRCCHPETGYSRPE